MTSIRELIGGEVPSNANAACVLEFVSVAPTPNVPFEYVDVKFVPIVPA